MALPVSTDDADVTRYVCGQRSDDQTVAYDARPIIRSIKPHEITPWGESARVIDENGKRPESAFEWWQASAIHGQGKREARREIYGSSSAATPLRIPPGQCMVMVMHIIDQFCLAYHKAKPFDCLADENSCSIQFDIIEHHIWAIQMSCC